MAFKSTRYSCTNRSCFAVNGTHHHLFCRSFFLSNGARGAPALSFFIFSFLFFWGIIGGEIIKGFKGKKKRGGRKGRFSSLFFARNSPRSAASFRELRLAVVLRSNSIRPSQSIAALIRRYALSNYFLLPAPTPWPYIADFTRPEGIHLR